MICNKKGFTIIEIMIVLVIIGFLSNMAVVTFGTRSEDAQETIKEADKCNIMTALELYALDNGFYPDDTVEHPLYILLGGEGIPEYIKMDQTDLDQFQYVLSLDKKSYTVSSS